MKFSPDRVFKGLPYKPGRRLLSIRYELLGKIPVRRELWTQDGVRYRSAVFDASCVTDLGDTALIRLAVGDPDRIDAATVERERGFVFVIYAVSI